MKIESWIYIFTNAFATIFKRRTTIRKKKNTKLTLQTTCKLTLLFTLLFFCTAGKFAQVAVNAFAMNNLHGAASITCIFYGVFPLLSSIFQKSFSSKILFV